jgi:signal transduction histidine kinase
VSRYRRTPAPPDEPERGRAELRAAELAALLSRDVGPPLRAIVGAAELAIDEWEATPDELKLDRVDRMHAQARRLGELLDDVLTMCRLDAGAVRPSRVPVALDAAVAQALGSVPRLAGLAAWPARRVAALADPGHLGHVLSGLLANAVEHGRPPVGVDAWETGDGWVELHVTDRGGGVPPEILPKLFDRFARAATGPGAGLGLFLASRLADANGGSLRYEPALPTGARFILRLEAVRQDRGAPGGAAAPPRAGPGSAGPGGRRPRGRGLRGPLPGPGPRQRRLGLPARHAHREGGALPGHRGDPDGAADGGRQLPGDPQAEPHAGPVVG